MPWPQVREDAEVCLSVTQPAADYDSPWKEALDRFLESALALLFPSLHAVIDWSRGYESLDKEFQRILRKASVSRRHADKLFKVWRRDGTETWLLIHVEVQGRRERGFPAAASATSASARRARFTAAEFGKRAATSGASTTTLVPSR